MQTDQAIAPACASRSALSDCTYEIQVAMPKICADDMDVAVASAVVDLIVQASCMRI